MSGFIEKVIVTAMIYFSCEALECVSMNNQECRAGTETIHINRNEPSFCPWSIKI